MSTGDTLRDWAVRLRSVIESAEAADGEITLRLPGGQLVAYELGVGLTYESADGVRVRVPEEALDEERWEVVA
jgi:hypothetical protein